MLHSEHSVYKCLLALPAQCGEQGLWNSTVSVRLSQHGPTATAAAGRFAAVGPADRRLINCCSSNWWMRAVPHCRCSWTQTCLLTGTVCRGEHGGVSEQGSWACSAAAAAETVWTWGRSAAEYSWAGQPPHSGRQRCQQPLPTVPGLAGLHLVTNSLIACVSVVDCFSDCIEHDGLWCETAPGSRCDTVFLSHLVFVVCFFNCVA